MPALPDTRRPAPGDVSRLETWLMYAVFFVLPFQFAAQLTQQDSGSVSLTVGKLMILLALAVCAGRVLVRRDPAPLRSLGGNAVSVLLILFVWMSLAGLVHGHRLILGLASVVQRISLVLLYFLVINLVTNLRALRHSMIALFLGSMVAACGGLYEMATRQALVANVYSKQNLLVTSAGSTRIQSFAGDPDMHGSFLVGTSGLLIYLLLSARRWWVKLLMIGCIFIYFVNIMGTGSRAAWIGIAVAGATFFIFQPLRHKFAILAGVLLVAAVTALALDAAGVAAISERVSAAPAASSGDKSIDYRIGWMIMSLHMFADHPLTGVGTGNYFANYYKYLHHAGTWSSALERKPNHNAFMQILAENGIFGFLIFCSLIATALWYGLQTCLSTRGEARNMAVGLLSCFMGWVYCICVYPAIADEYGWLALAFLVTLRRLALRPPAYARAAGDAPPAPVSVVTV